ncbi:glutamyl-tRNA reductase [Frisingicoccus sp.]|uniref:glutamyl-tRNA reductase n=1 Tax=Frisingicoccus sp. TaxID=1918627 RepID=UPI003AB1AA73
MSIQLISVSHKTADLNIRSCFALTREKQIEYLKNMVSGGYIEECVLLSTCNRLEIYLYGADENQREIFSGAAQGLLRMLEFPEGIDGAEYLRFYEGEKAERHLFMVAAGLDSMVMGEDQILGQVKEAQRQAREAGTIGPFLDTCFRYAVTGAKKVKTETALSRTPVSTATIAVKAAREFLGDLKGKNVLLIGASGKIGNSILKNLLSEGETLIYMTTRQRCHGGDSHQYKEIPYGERYEWLDKMDVIISATSSPHYTVTLEKVKKALTRKKSRVFVDLAVPPDIDKRVRELPDTGYYNIDDFVRVADENNRKKEKEAAAAVDILEDYRVQFKKWMIFQKSFQDVQCVKEKICAQAEAKGMDKAVSHFFFALRESLEPNELEKFMEALKKVEESYEKN